MPTFDTATSRSPISTRARASRSSWCTVRLQQGGELGQPGWVATLRRRAPCDRARQSRPRRVDQAVRSGRLSHRSHGRGRRGADGSPGLPRADVMGYSMGARITRVRWRSRIRTVRSVILGGVGVRLVDGGGCGRDRRGAGNAVARRRDRPAGQRFRAFAEQTKVGPKALAACIRGSRQALRARGRRSASACRRWSRSAQGRHRRLGA